jgi:hypothetical protein
VTPFFHFSPTQHQKPHSILIFCFSISFRGFFPSEIGKCQNDFINL